MTIPVIILLVLVVVLGVALAFCVWLIHDIGCMIREITNAFWK